MRLRGKPSHASFRRAAASLTVGPPRRHLRTAFWAAVQDAVRGVYRPFLMTYTGELAMYNRVYENVLVNGNAPNPGTGDSQNVELNGHLYVMVCSYAILEGRSVRFCIAYRPDGWGSALPGTFHQLFVEN